MDDVALIDQADSGSAVDRRGDRGVAELRLRIVDARLVGLDLRLELRYHGALGIELLAWA